MSMFGTDGVRGVPGRPPLDAASIARLGAALAAEIGGAPRIACGRDTRASGRWIEQHLAAGIRAGGGVPVSLGVLPTPGVAFVTARAGFDAGVVISASHNPCPDNGLKVIQATGEKASGDLERRIEARAARTTQPWPLPPSPAPAPPDADAAADASPPPASAAAAELAGRYEDHLVGIMAGRTLAGARIALDCAHGATSGVAARVLRRVGASVVELHAAPDGRNINAACGSTHPAALQAAVAAAPDIRVGCAFDGDGDRVILVDGRGRLVDGDGVLFAAARHRHAAGRLTGGGVVATVMSNFGLEAALTEAGIAVHRCQVGDAHVRQEMQRRGVGLGGEPSGHVIFADLLPTGDGLGTALATLRIMVEQERELADLVAGLRPVPQVVVNVPVTGKRDLREVPALDAAIRAAEERLAGSGRVLVRYSGTEPLLRVMIEGADRGAVHGLAAGIAACARRHLA